jgi:hypothetical protein
MSEPSRHRASTDRQRWTNWAGAVLSPAAWAFHHQLTSDLNYARCGAGSLPVGLAAGLISLAVIGLGAILSRRAWREAGGSPAKTQKPSARFIPAVSLLMAGLFGLTVLMQVCAALIVPACFR